MQLLIVPELTDTENYWLQSMRTDLQAGKEIRKLMCEYEKHRKSKDYAAVMDLITVQIGNRWRWKRECVMH